MKNKTTKTVKNSTKGYKTVKGIQSLPSGNYRVRKTINGQKVDGTFKRKKDAVTFLSLIMRSTNN